METGRRPNDLLRCRGLPAGRRRGQAHMSHHGAVVRGPVHFPRMPIRRRRQSGVALSLYIGFCPWFPFQSRCRASLVHIASLISNICIFTKLFRLSYAADEPAVFTIPSYQPLGSMLCSRQSLTASMHVVRVTISTYSLVRLFCIGRTHSIVGKPNIISNANFAIA